MQIQFTKDCAQLKQIGKSNNSHIYKEVNNEGESNGQALKLILHSEKGKHSKECNHLKNEFQILSKLNHPNIIGVKNSFQSDAFLGKHQLCAIEIELADQDLFDKMQTIYPKVLSPNQLRTLFMQILKAVEYLHQKKISHNDIKLENIFLFQQQQLAKIADFGFAKEQVSTMTGEQQYQDWKNRCKTMLAPEILAFISTNNDEQKNTFNEFKTDIWAIGVTLFQALYLRTPFVGDFPDAKDSMFGPLYSKNFKDFWGNQEIANISKFLEKQEDFRFEQFQDLIQKILAINPSERISIKQIINHPWFQSQAQQQQQMEQENSNCNIF